MQYGYGSFANQHGESSLNIVFTLNISMYLLKLFCTCKDSVTLVFDIRHFLI